MMALDFQRKGPVDVDFSIDADALLQYGLLAKVLETFPKQPETEVPREALVSECLEFLPHFPGLCARARTGWNDFKSSE